MNRVRKSRRTEVLGAKIWLETCAQSFALGLVLEVRILIRIMSGNLLLAQHKIAGKAALRCRM